MDGGAWMTTGRLEKVDAGAGVAVGGSGRWTPWLILQASIIVEYSIDELCSFICVSFGKEPDKPTRLKQTCNLRSDKRHFRTTTK
jgi:hypothetical protein